MMRLGKKLQNKEHLSPEEQEELFQEAMSKWDRTKNKKAWDEMWFRVYECCKAIAIKKAPGKPLLEERSMDAACLVMDRIERLGARPEKLSSYCYWPVVASIQGPKAKKEDQELAMQDEIEDYEEVQTNDEVRGICRLELMNTID